MHIVNGAPAKVPDTLAKIILNIFKYLMKIKERGINLFFTDIDKIKQQMMEELGVLNR